MIAALSHAQTAFWLIACAATIVLYGLYSGAETGLYCASRLRLNLAAHQRAAGASSLRALMADQSGTLFTTLLGSTLANYLAPVCMTYVFLQHGYHATSAEFLTTLILTPIILVFAEAFPKVLFERHADRLMLRLAGFLTISHSVARWTGLVAGQNALSRFILRRFHRQPPSGSALHSRLEMYHMLHEGAAQGALTRTQRFMLERVHALRNTRVASVMVPQALAVMLPDTARIQDILPIIRETPHSRLPVFSGTRRKAIGLVHVLDLLTRPPETPIVRFMYPPVAIPYDTDVTEALSTLQKRHRRMAFVVDEAGRCLGIVTVKDLVEEIVGDIAAW
jgi:CBS domain containing-hemolysin-like protein